MAFCSAGVAIAKIHLTDEITRLQVELQEKIKYFRLLSARKGLILSEGGKRDNFYSPIHMVYFSSSCNVGDILLTLQQKGIFAGLCCYPAIVKNKVCIRIVITVYHTVEQIDYLVTSMLELI